MAAAVSGNKQRFTLHGTMTSGPTYTVGLMLSLCRHPFSYIHVNLREGQHKQPDYLVKNRYGQVPTPARRADVPGAVGGDPRASRREPEQIRRQDPA